MELKRDGTGFAAAGGAESKKVSLRRSFPRARNELKDEGELGRAAMLTHLHCWFARSECYCVPIDGNRGRDEGDAMRCDVFR